MQEWLVDFRMPPGCTQHGLLIPPLTGVWVVAVNVLCAAVSGLTSASFPGLHSGGNVQGYGEAVRPAPVTVTTHCFAPAPKSQFVKSLPKFLFRDVPRVA